MLKNGLLYPEGSSTRCAACPMYASIKQGYAKQSHDNCTARRLKAPMSANRHSTPVKQRRTPPRLFQPSVLFRMSQAPAK